MGDKNKAMGLTLSDSKDNAIDLQNVSLFYKLYDKPKDRLKEALHPARKQYHKRFYALRGVNLRVPRGEILGVVGRNAAGKSSLLKVVSKVLLPSSGRVEVNGRISALLELGTGFNPDFSGLENVYLYGSIMGYDRDEMNARLDEILAFADIGQFIKQPVKVYSSGMRARLAFSVAVHIEPEILILDEILSVGDQLFRRKCFAKMEALFNSGCTVLFVSHNVQSVHQICSRAILMDKGELILDGPPKFVTAYYQKLIFSKAGDAKTVRKEIIELNESHEEKARFLSKKRERRAEKGQSRTPDLKKEEKDGHQKAYFLPGFKSMSAIEHRNFPVDFEEIQVSTVDGEKVNVLVMGEDYVCSYKVRFHIDSEQVFFNMAIRNEKGIAISTASTRDILRLKEVEKGSIYRVEWRFRCRLLQGNYFVTVAVSRIDPNMEVVVLNRILDAVVFKVLGEAPRIYWGVVSLGQKCSIHELDQYSVEERLEREQ